MNSLIMHKSLQTFILETMTFLIHPVEYISTDKKTQKNEEPGAVFGEVNEIMAKPHFYDDRWDFPNERSFQMFPAGEFAQYSDSGEENIGGVRDSPCQGHILHTAVLIQLCEHMLFLNDGTGLFAEENTADMKADFNADHFADPGNDNARNESEQGTIYSEEGDSRYAKYIAEDKEANAHQKSTISKRGNIVCQPIHITGHGQMDRMIIELRVVSTDYINGYDGSNDQDHKAYDLFTFVNHIVSFSPSARELRNPAAMERRMGRSFFSK
jgi:hypothetical protein